MRFVIAFVATLLIAVPGHADEAGGYVTFETRSCIEWIRDKKEDSWSRVLDVFWVSGYLTAANAYIPGKANWLEGSDLDSAMLWIDNYCEQKPLSNSVAAAAKLLIELQGR